MIELDKRIIEGKKPLTCFEANQAKFFVGEKCYLTNDLSIFANLDQFIEKEGCSNVTYAGVIDTLTNIGTEVSMIFETTYLRWKFCIPCEWVKQEPEKKEPKYRPYTLKEFIGDVNLGGPWIRMRPIGTKKECKFLYTGYLETAVGEYICLGCFQFDLISLFKNYEICVNGEWQPFGIEEQV